MENNIRPLRVGVVGCGAIFGVYMENMQNKFRSVEPVACCDTDVSRMQAAAEKYGVRAESLEEMLTDPEVELILNLTPPAAHFDLNRRALEAGKHVYTEKNLAVDPADARALVALSEEKGLRLGSAPDTFLSGSVQTARYIVDHGLIGKPTSILISLNRDYDVFGGLIPFLYNHGGGLTFDLGVYYLCAAASILGPVAQVSAMGTIDRPQRVIEMTNKPWFGKECTVEDETRIVGTLRYASGVLGSIHINAETISSDSFHLEIYGTKGVLHMGDPNNFDSPVYVSRLGVEKEPFAFTHGYTVNSRGVGIAEMAWAMAQNRPHRADCKMACNVLETICALSESVRTGRIIDLPTRFERPAALPDGYKDLGYWGPAEETALMTKI